MGDDANEKSGGTDQSVEKASLKTSQQSADDSVISGQKDQAVHGQAFAVTHVNDLRPSDPSLIATKDGESLEEYKARVDAIKNNPFMLVDSTKPGNGSAADTGTVLDYKPEQVNKNTLLMGMNYEERLAVRTPQEKLQDFVAAATQRATDPEGWKTWMQGEVNKVVGMGIGLNEAKEETKQSAKVAWNAFTDGTVVNFLSHPNAINDPMFHAIGDALDAMAKDPNDVNHVLENLGTQMMEASKRYSASPDIEKGKVIGKFGFFMINPEGSTEGGELALKIADGVATHVDAAVMKTIEQSMAAIREASPITSQEIKQSLYQYLLRNRLTRPELEYAGVSFPKDYFKDVPKGTDNFFAMSEDTVYRGDHDVYSKFNTKGRPKSYINESGDLTPANPDGMYKGKKVTVEEHLAARWCRGAKANSPYTSFGEKDGVVKTFGQGNGLTLDVRSLRQGIASGEVQGVRIYEHEEVIDSIKNSRFDDSIKKKLLTWATAHKEVVVEGIIPGQFVTLGLK